MNRRRFMIAAIGGLSIAPLTAGAQTADINGRFHVDGMNADGARYRGTVSVQNIGFNRYGVQWDIGQAVYTGHGTLEGRVLTVDWDAATADPAVYVIMPSGEVHGTWDNGRAVERWYRN